MKRWRTRALSLASAVFTALAVPAASQEAPESLLPPGFENGPPPPVQQPAPPPDRPDQIGTLPLVPPSDGGIVVANPTEAELRALAGLEPPKQAELPEWARRSTDVIGPLDADHWGLGSDAFGRAHGAFLSTLMRRLDAPVPSRWGSILLRRALLSRVPRPYGVNAVDWVAERAWLLLRMGEADGARMLVQAVDVEDFTPKMFGVAVQTALATADPSALCPLVVPGRKVSHEPVWPLAEAMCAALEGEASRASALIDQARRHSGAGGIDLLLAEKVVGSGADTRRAVTIEWEPVDSINSWRFGLASATGLVIPDRLMDAAGPRMRAWQARAPMLAPEQRLAAADVAASLGVFSNAAMVEIYSLVLDQTDPSDIGGSMAERLRTAYVGNSPDTRIGALRQIWQDAETPMQRHARWILTASAAARIEPSEDLEGDAPDLIAALLTAGLDRQAARWTEVAAGMEGAKGDRAWALLALASTRPGIDLRASRIDDFIDGDDSAKKMRSKLLLAGLAGLDRIPANVQASIADDLDIPLDRRNRWTLMIDSAAQKRQPGTVALLAAIGMQTADWRGVPPEYLYHIVRNLRLVGLEYEARMIAAEALTRL
jgi:hypothetical protein